MVQRRSQPSEWHRTDALIGMLRSLILMLGSAVRAVWVSALKIARFDDCVLTAPAGWAYPMGITGYSAAGASDGGCVAIAIPTLLRVRN